MRPAEADAAITAAGVMPEKLVHKPKPGPPRPMKSFVGEGLVLTTCDDPDGLRLMKLELAGRRWAQSIGLPGPQVIAAASDDSWMLATWVAAAAPGGPEYVRAALAGADLISAQPLPEFDVPATQWKGDSSDKLARIARLIIGRMPILAFRKAKIAADELTDARTAHGDYYFRNCMWTGSEISVIDWEFLGSAPAYTDHLRFWSTLKSPQDRALAMKILLADADEATAAHIRILAQWLALRLLAENLSAPSSQRDSDDLAHARIVTKEARAL